MDILSQIFYFIVIISILVFVHELGHFLAAKLFRMRVDQFSIGFPPRAFGKKIGDTDYCISYIPFGGYVKIAGMIDESMDTAHLAEEPKPWEFRAKPVWQRVIVIVAGVVMNVVLAIAIFWGMNLVRGRVLHTETTVGTVRAQSVAQSAGVLPGDRVLKVNGEEIAYWEDIERTIAYEYASGSLRLDIERNGQRLALDVPSRQLSKLGSAPFGVYARGNRALIGGVEPGLPAAKAGMEAEDVLVSVKNTNVVSSEDVIALVRASANVPIPISWMRDGKLMSATVTPNESGRIGIVIVNDIPSGTVTLRYGFFEAMTAGVRNFVGITVLTVQNIWHIIIGQASFQQSIGGPVKIAQMAAQQAEVGIESFLGLVAILSISLAIINILPFPVLDGGHLVFLIYEAIFKREVPNKIRIALQQAGMVLLLAFMAFVIYNDIFH